MLNIKVTTALLNTACFIFLAVICLCARWFKNNPIHDGRDLTTMEICYGPKSENNIAKLFQIDNKINCVIGKSLIAT